MSSTGIFTISLDTELAWGQFDTTDVKLQKERYNQTPAAIQEILKLFDEYHIPATWALVAHLLTDCEGRHDEPMPSFDWVNWMEALPCRKGICKQLWYAPEILHMIRDAEVEHEVGVHGYTHMILGEQGCSSEVAAAEVKRAVDILKSHGIKPESFIFPRNKIGNLNTLSEYGISVFRGRDASWFEERQVPKVIRKIFRFGEEFGRVTPSVVRPRERAGIVELPGSQVFRPNHNGWQYTPSNSQQIRAKKGIEKAAEEGSIFHLWFHPFNIAADTEALMPELQNILSHADKMREKGEIEIKTMGSVGKLYQQGRWHGGEKRD